MALQRIRTIKPEFFVHEDLAQLSFAARLLFVGLWTVADRVGRLEDRPVRLKALLFPYDQVDVDRLLEELNGHGFIRRYQVAEGRYLDIPTFEKHQRPSSRETDAQLPAYPGPSAPARKFLCTTKNFRAEREREREGNGKDLSFATLTQGFVSPRSRFIDFWLAYPKKRHRPAAERAWTKGHGDPTADAILAGVERWKRSAQWADGRIEDPATFLNQRQWEDPVPPASAARSDSAEAIAARLQARAAQERPT
jgi:hypothetical protein